MTEPTITPTPEEQAIRRLVDSLHALDDDQLETLVERVRQRSFQLLGVTDPLTGGIVPDRDARTDPVNKVEFAFEGLVGGEPYRRANLVSSLEADMRGGHLVKVSFGDDPMMYRAECDPRPDTDGPLCWEGPDRDTIEEAKEDGRQHHSGHEIDLSLGLRLFLEEGA